MPVYFARLGPEGPVKIGFAIDVVKRIKGMQTSHPEKLTPLRVIDGDMKVESAIHRRFAVLRQAGEWFKFHDDMLKENLGYPDLPVPLIQKGKRGRRSAGAETTANNHYFATITDIFETLGGKPAVAKRLGIPPWDDTLYSNVASHFSALALLMAEIGRSDITYQHLKDLLRLREIEQADASRDRQRETRVDREMQFITRHSVAEVYWPLAPETRAKLNEIAKSKVATDATAGLSVIVSAGSAA